MIAHLVLFRPRPDLTDSARQELAGAFTTALREIPSIRRAHIGKRIVHGRGYEASMHKDYAYSALLEFESVEHLRAYLEHPAHAQLGKHFWSALEDILVYDFELQEGEAGVDTLLRT